MIAVQVTDGSGGETRLATMGEEIVLELMGGDRQEEWIKMFDQANAGDKVALAKLTQDWQICQSKMFSLEGVFEVRKGDPWHDSTFTILKYRKPNANDTRQMIQYVRWKTLFAGGGGTFDRASTTGPVDVIDVDEDL